MYEDISNNQQSRAPAVEIDSLYTCATYNKATRIETDDDDYIYFTKHNVRNKNYRNADLGLRKALCCIEMLILLKMSPSVLKALLIYIKVHPADIGH